MTDNLWLRVAAHKLLHDRAKAAYDRVRLEAEQVMDKGDRKIVYAPDGQTKLGAVSKTAPEKTAGVGDAAAFLEWVKEKYPDDVDFDLDIVGPEDEVKAILYQHAKKLVKPVEKVSASLRAKVLEASNAYKAPAGPGGEVDVPGIVLSAAAESQVRFLPDDGGEYEVIELIRKGWVKLPDLLAEPEEPTEKESTADESAVDGA